MQFKTGTGCKQGCNQSENHAMGITQPGLGQEVSQETTSDEEHDGYSGRQSGWEIALSALESRESRVSAHERDISSEEKKSITIEIAGDQCKEDGQCPLYTCLV